MHDLTLVVPAKFEALCLPQVINEINNLNLNCKIIVSLSKEDHETKNVLKDFDVQIYEQEQNGYGAAIKEAVKIVKTKFFCVFNADGSFDPRELKKMYNLLILNQEINFVFASRYLKNASTKDDTIITGIGNYIFSFIGKFFFKLPISDILYTYVMGYTDIFKKINFKSTDFRLCVEIPILLFRNRYKIVDHEAHERRRIAGTKKPNAIKDGFLILIELIRLYLKKNPK